MGIRINWKGFELPSRLSIDEASYARDYAKFIIEPFEQGFGMTIGNSLRRILYSSVEGCAPVAVKMTYSGGKEGGKKLVAHIYQGVEGIYEDILDISLNIKGVVFEITDDEKQKVARLKVDKKGKVSAAQFECDQGLKIVTPEAHILELTEDKEVDVSLEVIVRRGRGYLSSEEIAKSLSEEGFVALDANFSPIKRVKIGVQATRVGQRTNYDRLIIELWTNGMVEPNYAIVEAAKILRKHLNPFVQFANVGLPVAQTKAVETLGKGGAAEEGESVEKRNLLSRSIDDIDLSNTIKKKLKAEEVQTIGDLVEYTESELKKKFDLEDRQIKEIKEFLSKNYISLKE